MPKVRIKTHAYPGDISRLSKIQLLEKDNIGKTECGYCDVFFNNTWCGGVKVPNPITIHLVVDVRVQGNRELSKILNDIHEALNRNVEAIPGVIDFLKVGIAPDFVQ